MLLICFWILSCYVGYSDGQNVITTNFSLCNVLLGKCYCVIFIGMCVNPYGNTVVIWYSDGNTILWEIHSTLRQATSKNTMVLPWYI